MFDEVLNIENINKQFINVLRIKLKLDKKTAAWTYTFLVRLARFTLCESYILSSDEHFFSDFLNLQKQAALDQFEKYYGVIEDYDLNINQIAKAGTFFNNLLSDFDSLIIRYYWESIVKASSSKELRYKILEVCQRILPSIFRVDNMMGQVYQGTLQTIKKTIIKNYIKNIQLNNEECEKIIVNFLAFSTNNLHDIVKAMKKVLKKADPKLLLQALKLESWLFENRFRNSLQWVLTSGFVVHSKLINYFQKITKFLNEHFDEVNDEEFLDYIYSFRKAVLFQVDKREGKFYKNFISKYDVFFKHKGTYSISYLEKQNKEIQNNLIKYHSVKPNLNVDGTEYLAKQVRHLRKRMEHYATVLAKRKSKKLNKKKHLKYSLWTQGEALSKKKEKNIDNIKIKCMPLRDLEKKIATNKVSFKVDLKALILSLRRATVFFHIFAKEQEYMIENAQFLYQVFCVVILDSIFEVKNDK